MSIPGWLAQERAQTCARCQDKSMCPRALFILLEDPRCPRGVLPVAAQAIAARAWPDAAEKVSGCCDPVASGWGSE